jgi:SAM-dependent methyltransferase
MKLSNDQRDWFDTVRSEWNERVVPNATLMGQHVFDVGARIPQAAVARAQVFANRTAALAALPAGGRVAELGTQAGWFAEQVTNTLRPDELHLFDLEFDTLRGARPAIAVHTNVRLHVGDSSTELAKLPDHYFDWIYIDGDHSLEGVRRDADVAVRKVKPDGILVFNDYTVWSVLEFTDYGIVPVVNELLAGGEWEMAYIALHPLMYCDVAIRRPKPPPRGPAYELARSLWHGLPANVRQRLGPLAARLLRR